MAWVNSVVVVAVVKCADQTLYDPCYGACRRNLGWEASLFGSDIKSDILHWQTISCAE